MRELGGMMTEEFDERHLAKSRAVCEAMHEEARGKKGLTEREQRILDIWPKFEDGERVLLGDDYVDAEGNELEVDAVSFDIFGASLVNSDGFHDLLEDGERVKRPSPPDSWEQLEMDAEKSACDYFDVNGGIDAECRMCPHFHADRDCSLDMNADIIRRAKALAGVGAC